MIPEGSKQDKNLALGREDVLYRIVFNSKPHWAHALTHTEMNREQKKMAREFLRMIRIQNIDCAFRKQYRSLSPFVLIRWNYSSVYSSFSSKNE